MEGISRRINLKQPKYVFCIIGYVGTLLIGGLIINIFDTKIEDKGDPSLKTTEYLNSELPEANIREEIGSKRQNVQDVFGNISDFSSVENIADDRDSVNKKEDFESRYTVDELEQLQQQQAEQSELERLRKENADLRASQSQKKSLTTSDDISSSMGENDFNLPLSDSDRAKLNEMRRNGQLADMERELIKINGTAGVPSSSAPSSVTTQSDLDSLSVRKTVNKVIDETGQAAEVVKKSVDESKYFNSISDKGDEFSLIRAIVDEEVRVVDGSRVRLRLLDDVVINDVTMKRGTYIYATMSGFSKQRVQGSVNSVLVDEKIQKVNLRIYDMDGMEGLYVPQSSFKETAKDIASSATNSSLNMSNTSSGNNIAQWAMQGVQNATQQVSSAISKAIKKNKVRIKYGTKVYLFNSKNGSN